jgi:hypothetical protein
MQIAHILYMHIVEKFLISNSLFGERKSKLQSESLYGYF